MNRTAEKSPAVQTKPELRPLRFITAASLFDGHDAAINIMRRLIQAQGGEVIHLGHNRSVDEVVSAAIQEDADAIAISSYQGGHNEYFRYMVDRLRECGAGHIQIFAGGGGTITLQEIDELQDYGVERIYHPHDGLSLGLVEMIEDLVARSRKAQQPLAVPGQVSLDDDHSIATMISAIENDSFGDAELKLKSKAWAAVSSQAPVVGITGTGGAGKSSLTDELLNRFQQYFPKKRIAVLAVDPTRRRSGGALLGDRIRMNSLRHGNIYMRSMATRRQHRATSAMLRDIIAFLKASGFNLILVETAGIGQSDSEIVDLVDFPMYVMTSDFGAASQLEKIDMLDFAKLVVLNKYDRRGAEDALRDVRKQWKRNNLAFDMADEQVPVYPTIASQFNDPGLSWMFANLCRLLQESLELPLVDWQPEIDTRIKAPRETVLIPAARQRYLAEITESGRAIKHAIKHQIEAAGTLQSLYLALQTLADEALPELLVSYLPEQITASADPSLKVLRERYNQALHELSGESLQLLRQWPSRKAQARTEQFSYMVRNREVTGANFVESLSALKIPKLGLPAYTDWGSILRFLLTENLPGYYPFTAGLFPYRRAGEDPTRMFAGEGTPERTNRRFHLLAAGQPTARLSTAFDSVTLYGEDPHLRPDIFGKIGNSGVSIAALDDMKKLYSGFDLCAPTTSVSMTINGPAPMILAFYMNTAIDQQVEKYLKDNNQWEAAEKTIDSLLGSGTRPQYLGELPSTNNGLGLAMLGVTGDQLVDRETYERIRKQTLMTVRGTVQADILKEDQAQNTCIFATEFALRMMGDIQQFFVDNQIGNFYSVSISGYHIAEAGANPISQLAFTLSNGFTIVEYYLARGMKIDDFAGNLSFFFSNGMDAEYAVIGRVARRIWARAMRERFGASERSQKLKYHIQTSGRSLHAQEIQFNDIRTTLQALYALYDNCNSLHTNAYDEAITTPTEESVRRAVAIQLIINRELGLNVCENSLQGSFIIEELTELVEEAVYAEFERISDRGGVLGAMDTMYQRGKIQEESMLYEHKKHDGSLPIVGVNTFLDANADKPAAEPVELARSTTAEKNAQVSAVEAFRAVNQADSEALLDALAQTARQRENTFAMLMEVARSCSLGQMSNTLYSVGGEYRRNM
ncbi:MAG: methylmalonyl-CoA mutase family protein [Xanthomonadales bacterium]|nr:methylmalonyl-CoA mutase family protein [Xanthomonadales bacterium]